MIQLARSMMERYEIAERRPSAVRAALFGADRATLGIAARLLDRANELGGDLGAVCFTSAAETLRAQDCMFTLLVRGEGENGDALREERVVQSILAAIDPEAEFDRFLEFARRAELEFCMISDEATAVELALLARFLHARWEAKQTPPTVLLLSEDPEPEAASNLRNAVAALAQDWTGGAQFAAWLESASFRATLCESILGRLSEAERARAQREMNYRDDLLAWAEPQLRCTIEGGAPEPLAPVCAAEDFELACARKLRAFDSLVFLCAALGFLGGKNSFAQTLKDEDLRGAIGRIYFDELLPAMPWPREEISPYVIQCFARLENPMNEAPLLELGRDLLSRFPRTLLPAIREYAAREFAAPPGLTQALSAAILIYAGARRNERGEYEVQRDGEKFAIRDTTKVLETFAQFSPDMPAESLAYAVLADRELWGEDLREIEGLEPLLSLDLATAAQ